MSHKNILGSLLVLALSITLLPLWGSTISKKKKNLLKALRKRDEQAVTKAIKSLVVIGGKKSIKVFLKLAEKFPPKEEKFYWMILQGATSYHDQEALKKLGKYLISKRKKGLSRDLLFALAQNTSWEVLSVLQLVLEKAPYDLKLMAVDQIASIQKKESVDALLKAWAKIQKKKKNTSTLKERIIRSLTDLTGENMGDMYPNWRGWWDQNRSRGLKEIKNTPKRTGTVIDRFSRSGRSEVENLKELDKRRILVIQGSPCGSKGVDHNFDHIEHALDNLGIPYTVVTKKEFNQSSYSLKGVIFVLLNCTLSWEHCVCPTCKATGPTLNRLQSCGGCATHVLETDVLSKQSVQKLKIFAERGGYIFTEDWGLAELLQKAWPKMLRKGPSTLKEFHVNILPGRYQGSHPYLRGIFGWKKKKKKSSNQVDAKKTVIRSVEDALKKIQHSWTVDKESPSINIINKYQVIPILVSQELGKKMKGNRSVAVTFPVLPRNRRPVTGSHRGEVGEMRGGRVLHVISHFGKQSSAENEYTLQNLLLNFALEAKKRFDHRKNRKK